MSSEENKELDELARVVTEYTVEDRLKEKYSKLISDNHQVTSKGGKILNLRNISKIASILIVVLVSVVVIGRKDNQFTDYELAHRYLETTNVFGNAEITRKGVMTQDKLRSEANMAFSKKDFRSAISKYSEMNVMGSLSNLDQYYLGVSYLRDSDYQEAIVVLSTLTGDVHAFSEELNWLLGLAYVITGQNDRSSIILKQIINGKSYKYKEAKQLLNTIKAK